MILLSDTLSSPLVRRLLWRTAGFAFMAFALLAAAELWFERRSERAEVHQRAVRATGLALASIEHAVWTYDQPNLRVAVDSLLSDNAIESVTIDTPEQTMRLHVVRPDAAGSATAPTWELALHAPNRVEVLGRVEVAESFRQVEADIAARAAYRLPIELLKVLGIVVGLTLLAYAHVVARLRALARQVRELGTEGDGGEVRDIGAQRYAGDEVHQLTLALNELLALRAAARTAALARERAEASSQAKSELLSRISHELRTPLNAIVGFAHVLQADEVVSADPIRADRVELIGKAGRHLSALIGDLMDFSRIERGAERVQLEAVALDAICRDALALVAADAGAAGVALSHRYAPDAGWVMADPTRLGQVLLNLLSNAIKYNHEHGRVELTTTRVDEQWVEIRVIDDGLGMNDAQLAALFQPFNRLGREVSNRPGTGLGLVISRRLVELMSGDLEVTSNDSRGSEFLIRLPAASGPAQAAPCEVSRAPVPCAAALLYVEDDPVNIEVMRAVLASRGELELRVASTLAAAASALRADKPRLMLLDMHLPDGDGDEFLRRLRGDPDFAALPVLVVSADAEEQGQLRALNAGANGYFAKPIDFAALLARIDELLAARVMAQQ
ncbi:MAG: ATP-binding protein [Burkholderiaceae bacterium]|jgi:signal transduction histidine kinase/CheY-like chemotaxis protein